MFRSVAVLALLALGSSGVFAEDTSFAASRKCNVVGLVSVSSSMIVVSRRGTHHTPCFDYPSL
jgi:hypothetical protein